MSELPHTYRLVSSPDMVLGLGAMTTQELMGVQDHLLVRAQALAADIQIIEQHITTALVGPMLDRLAEINEERRGQP